MPTFELKLIEEITCPWVPIFKLFKDGNCAFDDFEANLEDYYKKDIDRIYTILELVGNGTKLPYKMFHPVKGIEEAFEAKAGDLRVYGFRIPKTGNIVLFGGYKGTQKQDIAAIPAIIREYLNFLTQTN